MKSIFSLFCGFVFLGFSFIAVADENLTPNPLEAPIVQSPRSPRAPATLTSRDNRSLSTLSINGSYAFYSFIVSGKKGVQAAWQRDESLAIEAEYFTGSYGLKKYGLNLASFEEKLIIVHIRHFFKNSFNLTYGLGRREYSLELGSRILQYVPDAELGKSKTISVQNYVLDFGLGNRWQFDNGITVGADWFSMQTTIGKSRVRAGIVDDIDDEDTRKGINKMLGVLKYFPTLTFIKLNIGYLELPRFCGVYDKVNPHRG